MNPPRNPPHPTYDPPLEASSAEPIPADTAITRSDDFESPQSSDQDSSAPGRRWLYLILGLLGLGGIAWLLYGRVVAPLTQGGAPPGFGPMRVSLAQPTLRPVQDSTDYVANLGSRKSLQIQPQASGRVSQIYVRPGDRVEANEPLLRLDATEQEAQVAGSQAAINTANAEIAAANAELESARRDLEVLRATQASREADLQFKRQEYDRFRQLQAQGATSLQSLQEKESAWNQARASLAEIKAQISAQAATIARAQANVMRTRQQRETAIAAANQAQAQLKYYTVVAPITGVVGEINAKVGDLVASSTALLDLTQNQMLEVNIDIPQEDAARLALNLPVQLIDNQGKVLKSGQVSFISPNVNPQTQSVQVKANFSNVGGQLRTNQFITARIIWESRRGVLVPTTAISRLAGKNFVFVAQPYGESSCQAEQQGPPPAPDQLVAVQKPVDLGAIVGNAQEVSAGLNPSERIVTSGLLQLQNCAPIQANP
ncbi:efflux RND transporter periplasmic adaptor subunit [Lyngbya confervoides]|uniref:Efflux RND transporter periplasmic adaptor subunit n=1 Tax=Lyngbya confervoides BDU141951 TaxID=1574623 RepID=A0ABD4T074_9CYAN|nr:efflux RND transporter periplasmic adaptor subunit [Lyngbya confervoides]MCM1981944.1 efflux RND transporter periplasmic adaptor subunit [Lyngbya confervoides BDU141951]